MKPFDNYEISPCRRLNAENEPDPNGLTFEVCEPHEADVWTLYGHIHGEGVEAIGDFATREQAEETFQRFTGIPFGASREAMDRLRVMHAGPKLLEACNALVEWVEAYAEERGLSWGPVQATRRAIAEATGREA